MRNDKVHLLSQSQPQLPVLYEEFRIKSQIPVRFTPFLNPIILLISEVDWH